ncbi:MAG: hypothetical protein QXM86_03840 [Candidatus Bathyarchaeia archaeon]
MIKMKAAQKFDRRIQIFFHTLGLSCLGGAIFLQILVFTDILQHGYFMAVENNLTILFFEIALTVFAAIYFLYIYQRFIRSIRPL